MIQSISELSMWADNFGGTLRIATQPGGPYYGTDGELLGRHVHGVSYKSGVGKEFFIDGKNTASPSSVATFSGSLKTIYILGAVTSKYTYDGNEWVALWDRELTKEEGEFVTANLNNIYQILEPRTIYIEEAAAGGDTALVSSVTGNATTASQLTTGINLVGNINAQATVAAELTTGIPLTANVSTQASIAAELMTGIDLVASVNAQASVAADLTTSIPLGASAMASATVSADLEVGATTALAASVSANASVAADLTTGISLGASVSAQVSSAAQLTTGINFVSNVSAQASASADLTTSIGLASSVVANCGTVADLTTGINLVSNVVAQVTTLADLFTGNGVGRVTNPRIDILTAQRRMDSLTPVRRIQLH